MNRVPKLLGIPLTFYLRKAPIAPVSAIDWADLIQIDPLDPKLRAHFAAALIRENRLAEASDQLEACLQLAPPRSKPRLLIVVLRARTKIAARREALLRNDLKE